MMENTDVQPSILDRVDERLREWAGWVTQHLQLGVSFPSCSLAYRLMTEGYVVREYIGLNIMPVYPAPEEIEDFIREMTSHHRIIADVLRVHYLMKGSVLCKARYLCMSPAQFKIHLLNARWWLAGRFGLAYARNNFQN